MLCAFDKFSWKDLRPQDKEKSENQSIQHLELPDY